MSGCKVVINQEGVSYCSWLQGGLEGGIYLVAWLQGGLEGRGEGVSCSWLQGGLEGRGEGGILQLPCMSGSEGGGGGVSCS